MSRRKTTLNSKKPNPQELEELEAIMPELSEDGKLIVAAITLEFSKVKAELLVSLQKKDEEISALKSEVSALQKKISTIEESIDEADSYERRDTVIVSGPSVPNFVQGENTSEVFRQVIREKLRLNLNENDVSVAHRLGGRPANQTQDKRSIIVKLCRRETKKNLIITSKRANKADSGLFINESLSPVRRKIFFILRKIRNEHRNIVQGCGSIDGRIFVYTKSPSNERGTKHLINSHEKLVEFCRDYIKVPLESFLSDFQ